LVSELLIRGQLVLLIQEIKENRDALQNSASRRFTLLGNSSVV